MRAHCSQRQKWLGWTRSGWTGSSRGRNARTIGTSVHCQAWARAPRGHDRREVGSKSTPKKEALPVPTWDQLVKFLDRFSTCELILLFVVASLVHAEYARRTIKKKLPPPRDTEGEE